MLSVFSALQCDSQTNTTSPYSRFGIGELESQNSVFGSSLSGATTAINPFFSVNFNNPASYSSLAVPVFQTGLTVKNFQLENSETSESDYLTKINELSVGLPLGKGFGAAFGFYPFSSVGYEVSQRSELFPDSTGATYEYSGNGGYTKGYLGISYKKSFYKDYFVFNDKEVVVDTVSYLNQSVSLGINGNILFGNSEYQKNVIFDDLLTSFHRIETDRIGIGDASYNIGLLYNKNLIQKYRSEKGRSILDKRLDFQLGVVYAPANSINMSTESVVESATWNTNILDIVPLDTVSTTGNLEGKAVLPSEFRIGGSFNYLGRTDNEWVVSFDIRNQDWNQYSNSLEDGDVSVFDNVEMYSFGIQWTPKVLTSKKSSWINSAVYSAGLRTGNSYLRFSDEVIDERRVSFGASFPFLGSRSLSRINLGMDFGNTGTIENGLIKETFWNTYIGISITPHQNDGWFKQSKYR